MIPRERVEAFARTARGATQQRVSARGARRARCRAPTPRTLDRCPRVVLHWSPHFEGMREVGYEAHEAGYPTIVSVCRATGLLAADYVYLRPMWRRAGDRGRACRDPRKHAATCKVMP